MPPRIPDRWTSYKECGKVIEGTRIICFKVPLKKSVQVNNKEIKKIWDVNTLLQTIQNLGAVVDLTNTSRYYNPQELEAAGVQHKKILMPGRVIPPASKVKEFMDAVDDFLGKDREFEIARGYQIERENYIADILGAPPTEPDLGQHTDIKPINIRKRKHDLSYQSPLEQCEFEDHQGISRFGKRRYDNNSGNSNDDSRDYSNWRRRGSDTHFDDRRNRDNWRRREFDTSNDNRRSNWRKHNPNKNNAYTRDQSNCKSNELNKPYDYKYDY